MLNASPYGSDKFNDKINRNIFLRIMYYSKCIKKTSFWLVLILLPPPTFFSKLLTFGFFHPLCPIFTFLYTNVFNATVWIKTKWFFNYLLFQMAVLQISIKMFSTSLKVYESEVNAQWCFVLRFIICNFLVSLVLFFL